uniref:Peptidase S9 prolyl oligopeptidase catalytic domain-containing protein n=1 Tax=Calcidiscus leptoporus TaxID=127549 RepID=A0A7S0JGR4_9EUKA|mmetsp:Transcript_57078/g.131046  ORF Transcript_57078/g.131046 Transcript_57078/m.131046 type:complete len:166 (+) Transcript_57078:317-814(+)
MQVWYWAAVDERVSAPAPAIGVQGFGYAMRQQCWHARVGSLQPFFDEVSRERGVPTETACVRDAWDKLLPGLIERFDAQHTLGCIAPRPLLIANNAADPRCPRAGVEEAVAAARPAWGRHASRLELLMDESVATAPLPASEWRRGHLITPAMWSKIDAFIERHVR